MQQESTTAINTFLQRVLGMLFLLISTGVLAQQAGIFQTYAIVNRGNGNEFRAGGFNADGAALFQNWQLGSFFPNQTLILNGGEIKTFKNGGGDVLGAEISYRVYPFGTNANLVPFTTIDLPFSANLFPAGDQRWARTAHNVNLLAGRTAGTWVLEVFWRIRTNLGDRFDSRFGQNFQAFFNVLAPAPAGAIAGPSSACAGATNLQFSVPVITGATSYNWVLPTGYSIVSGQGSNAISVNLGPSAASGTISVTGQNAAGTGTASNIAFTVNPNPSAPTITANGALQFCEGGSVELTSSYASGNLWSNGATTQSIVVDNSASLSVVHTDANGCQSGTSSAVEVTEFANPSSPTITASGALQFCEGGSVELTSSYASGNLWSNGATTQSIVVDNSASLSVVHTDANGCQSSASAVVEVTEFANPAAPTITANGALQFCEGGSVELTSSYASGNLWSNGATTQSIVVDNSASLSVVHTDANGCQSSTSAVVEVTEFANPAAPTITANGALQFCEGGSVELTSSYASGNLWSNGATTQSIVVDNSASLSVVHTDANGCQSGASAVVEVTEFANPAAPVITSSGSTSLCSGGVVTLSSSYENGNVWSTGSQDASIQVSAAGSYTVVHTDANGCQSPASAPVVVVVNPGVSPCSFTELNASKSYNPTVFNDGLVSFCSPVTLQVPPRIDVTSGNAGNHWSFIRYTNENGQNITLVYRGGSSQAHPSGANQINLGQRWNYFGAYLNYNGALPPNQPNIGLLANQPFTTSALRLTVNGSNRFGTTGGRARFVNQTLGCNQARYADDEAIQNEEVSVEWMEEQSYVIYPNPSNSEFQLETFADMGNVQIEVWDASGRLIERHNTNNNSRVQLGANWKPGIYIVRLFGDDFSETTRLIKN